MLATSFEVAIIPTLSAVRKGGVYRTLTLATQVVELGYAVLAEGLTAAEMDSVLQEIEGLDPIVRTAGHGGVRDVFRRCPPLRSLVTHSAVRAAVEAVVG